MKAFIGFVMVLLSQSFCCGLMAAEEDTDLEPAARLKAFSTDGCSEFPDGTLEHKTLWQKCCIQHDLAYWLGGTEQQRADADQALKVCVAAVGEPQIAAIMLAGVRVGGSPFWPTPYRWGYGWPYWDGNVPRGYKALTEEELQQAEAMKASVEGVVNKP